MFSQHPSEFRHTTLSSYPDRIVGITLLDEDKKHTGIYMRDAKGGLWPARTVARTPARHHREVCKAWIDDSAHKGRTVEDKRSVK